MILDDIGTLLVANDLVDGTTGWALKKAFMPSSPDQVVALFESPGRPPEPTPSTVPQAGSSPTDPTLWVRYPVLQVRIRGEKKGYSTARAQLEAIFRYLHARIGEVVGNSKYLHILALGDPLPIGEDDVGRPEITQNFTLAIQETA